jgi:hypothetical protein
MRFEPMAPLGATALSVHGRRSLEASRRAGAEGADRSAGVFPLLGRSLIVCSALAAGFSSTVVALGWQIDGLPSAQAASLPVVDMPKPRVRLAPDPFTEQRLTADLFSGPMWSDRNPDEAAALAHLPADRVPPDVLMPDETEAGPDLSDPAPDFSNPNELLEFGPMRVVANAAERERILNLRRDPYLATLLAAEMLARDRARIARAIGRDLTDGETYLAHFLCPDDAERFLAKVSDEPAAVASKLLPRPARANKPIFFARKGRKTQGLSVVEVHRKFEAMMELRLARYRNVQQVVGAAVYAEASPR